MRLDPRLYVVVIALSTAACASHPFDRHFRAHRYVEAALAFEADTALQSRERALLRAAIVHALPGPTYQPARARELLDTFLLRFPRSPRRADVAGLSAIVSELDRLARRQRESGGTIDSLRREIDRLESHIGGAEQQAAQLRLLVEHLDAALREREADLRALRDELARLKDIDLRPGRGSY